MRLQRENNLELLFKVLAHDQIKFDPELITDKDFIIGARCTSIVKPNDFDFLHDLSHLVQFNESEIYTHYINNGGKISFDLPQEWLFNQWICEPVTDQISMRELETFYIQYILDNEILKKEMSWKEWIEFYEIDELLSFLPDRYNFGNKITIDEIIKKCDSFIDKWSFEKIIEKWRNIKIK